jgi:uncharacterized DUF497 family protein
MQIEYDEEKDGTNLRKHKVSLSLGKRVLENCIGEELDPRHGDEERWIAFGLVELRLFVCVYTMRRAVYRIISVRRATRREEHRWLS